MGGRSAAQPVPFVRRVRVRNYRSIADCDVVLGPLTVLVGFNASGKSNFLDVLRFVADALQSSLPEAVTRRGGLDAILHRTPRGAADSFEIRLDLTIRPPHVDADLLDVSYGFEVQRDPSGRSPLLVRGEDLEVRPQRGDVRRHPMGVVGGPASRLVLPLAAVRADQDQALADSALRVMRFYELDSAKLGVAEDQVLQPARLGPAGEHLGQVLGELHRYDPAGKDRLDAYLAALVPNLVRVEERREGRFSTVEAHFLTTDGSQSGRAEVFPREAMSEGTLLGAGVLAALHQRPVFDGDIPLIGIEEPETALNPTRLGALYEALDDASLRAQVIVTTQSSDLLDSEYATFDQVRVVSNADGATRIGKVGAGGREVVERGLMSISELHRAGLMEPAPPDDDSDGADAPGGTTRR